MAVRESTLLESKEVAEETLLLRLEKPEDFDFEPGQSVDVSLPGLEQMDAKGNMRALSIASAPSAPYIEIATRIRESAFKLALKGMTVGTPFHIDGPFGSFVLHKDVERPAVILAGGIGITPFRSMILNAVEQKTGHQIYLFYANRRPEDASFLKELMALNDSEETITVVPTMTEIKTSAESWNGETGYITYEMLEKHGAVENNPIYYIAGPQGMVLSMRDMLVQNKVSKDNVKFEEFSGY